MKEGNLKRDQLADEPRPDAYIYDPEADAAREAQATGHEGYDQAGGWTRHKGALENCPAPECQDRVIEQQEDLYDSE